MFLITPRSRNNGVHAQDSQPVAKIKAAARVHAACDRCRIKKVKCDGYKPCLRCSQDEVICIVSSKSPTDPKASSLEYIRSMEARQSLLIKALSAVTRHVRQPVGESELKEILEIVRQCGFDFKHVGNQFNLTQPISEILQGRGPKDHKIRDGHPPGKRKRGEEASDNNRIPTQVADPDEPLHLTTLDTVMCLQQDNLSKNRPVPGPVDDYWNLDAYWDQVAAPFQCVSATNSSETFPAQPNYPLPSQDQADCLNRMLDGIFQSGYNPNLHTQSIEARSATGVKAPIDSDATFSSVSTFNQPEWDSTLWWDPSLLFNTTPDTSPS